MSIQMTPDEMSEIITNAGERIYQLRRRVNALSRERAALHAALKALLEAIGGDDSTDIWCRDARAALALADGDEAAPCSASNEPWEAA